MPEARVLGERLARQLLAGDPAPTPEAAVERLLAVQAQDGRGFRLAVRARTGAPSVGDLEAALSARRSLVVTWLNRGTLHLVTAADYRLLQPLTTPRLATGNARRLQQEGVTPAEARRGVAVIADQVAEGPRTRPQLAAALRAAGVPVAGQALVHLLLRAALAGLVVRGPLVAAEHAYVAVDDWLGPAPDPLDRPAALATLARRYLAGHGPADARDLARWAGIPLGDARAGLAAIAAETRPVGDLVTLADGRPEPRAAPPRLLGAYEPVLLGWASRAPITGEHDAAVVSGGLFRPFALADGRAVATWRWGRSGIGLEPLEPLPHAVRTALERDGEALREWLRPR